MKLSTLHMVEGDPEKGGIHVKRLGDVLRLNQRAFVTGKPRNVIPLAAAGSLEEANAVKRDLAHKRKMKAIGTN